MTLLIDDTVENLIEEVQKRPALYRKTLKEYSDPYLKKKLWEEVCAGVVSNWATLNRQEQAHKGHEVQKKWQNLRTCFSRELKLQKGLKSGQSCRKRRKYIYFDKLLFLLPSVQSRPNSDVAENLNLLSEREDNDATDTEEQSAPRTPRGKRRKAEPLEEIHEERKAQVCLTSREVQAADRHFALSLVPLLSDLSESEKLDAKIQILQIFQQIRMNRVEPAAFLKRPAYSTVNQATSSVGCGVSSQLPGGVLQYVKSPLPEDESSASNLSAESPSDLSDLQRQFLQEGQANSDSIQNVGSVKQELPDFLETIRDDSVKRDFLSITSSQSENLDVAEDCNLVKQEPDFIQIKQETDDDQVTQTFGSRAQDPNTSRHNLEHNLNGIEVSQMDLKTDPRDLDLVDLRFLDFAKRFKRLPAKTQVRVDGRFCQVLAEAEVEGFDERQQYS